MVHSRIAYVIALVLLLAPTHARADDDDVSAPVGPDATITALQPNVEIWHRGAPEWVPGKIGAVLVGLDQMRTLAGASATLRARDRSIIRVGENAAIAIDDSGEAARTRHRSSAMELTQGELRVTNATGLGTQVTTPAAGVTITGATASVSVDAGKVTRVSVVDGTAVVAAQGKSVEVAAGSGTRVAAGGAPEAAQRAPESPAWTAGGSYDTVLTVRRTTPVGLHWGDSEGAAGYRLEVARNESFETHLLDRTFDANAPHEYELPQMEIGRYFARVSALSAAGLGGPPSPTKMIDVRQLVIESGGPDTAPGSLSGAVEIRVRLPNGIGARARVDGFPEKENPIVIRGLGVHKLEVAVGTGAPQVYACTVEVPRAKVTFSRNLRQVQIQFFDRQGRPVAFMRRPDINLGLRGDLGTRALEPEPVGDGHVWRADITPYSAMSTQIGVAVQVIWNGQPIGGGHAEATVE